MIKNICKIRFRSLDIYEVNFTEIAIAHSSNTLEISDEDTPSGKIFNYHLRAILKQSAFYRFDGLQFNVVLSDNTQIFIGNDDIPALMRCSENTDGAEISVDWKYWNEPEFLPL